MTRKAKTERAREKGDLDARDVYDWAKKQGTFTSDELAKALKLSPGRTSAFLAVMRSREQIEPAASTDSSSGWKVAGPTSF